MRPVRHRMFATNGTPNSLQATVMKDFSPGLQIRPRRFDSGFGLHIRKPRRPWSAGFFYACDLADHFRNFWDRFRNLLFLGRNRGDLVRGKRARTNQLSRLRSRIAIRE